MEDDEIRLLVKRIARRKGDGASVERATLLAEGSDVEAIEAWILSVGGTPEGPAPARRGQGLYADRVNEREASRTPAPLRYILPPGALDAPAAEPAPEREAPPA